MSSLLMRREPHASTDAALPLATARMGAASVQVERVARRVRRARRGLAEVALAALALVALVAANETARHRLVEALATLCVAGGFVAAPFLTVVAWVGVLLPVPDGLRQLSGPLFAAAALWLALAVIGSHVYHQYRGDDRRARR